jgi:hypothetical protein
MLSKDKTKITHIGSEKAHFLGVDITSPKCKDKVYEKGKVKKRISTVRIKLTAPYSRIIADLEESEILKVNKGK